MVDYYDSHCFTYLTDDFDVKPLMCVYPCAGTEVSGGCAVLVGSGGFVGCVGFIGSVGF